MEGYSTRTFDYSFYFPEPEFPPLPGPSIGRQGNRGESRALSFTGSGTLPQGQRFLGMDFPKWIGQGRPALLSDNNLNRLDLSKIAFRMKEQGEGGSGRAFYEKTLEQLGGRFHFDSTLWSYAVYHKDEPRMRNSLTKSSFANNCGKFLRSPLLTVDPVELLVRATRIRTAGQCTDSSTGQETGNREQPVLRAISSLARDPQVQDSPGFGRRLAATYYHFLQDRVEEGIRFFEKIDRQAIDEKLQYDYLASTSPSTRETLPGPRNSPPSMRTTRSSVATSALPRFPHK